MKKATHTEEGQHDSCSNNWYGHSRNKNIAPQAYQYKYLFEKKRCSSITHKGEEEHDNNVNNTNMQATYSQYMRGACSTKCSFQIVWQVCFVS